MTPPDSIGVRPYDDADRTDIAKIWYDGSVAMADPLKDQPSREDLKARLVDEGRAWSIHVAVVGSEIAGFIAFQHPDSWLRQLFVAPAHQRTGVGTALLNRAKREMPEGFWLRTDAVNAVARRFYEAAGLRVDKVGAHPVHGQLVATYVYAPT